MPQGDLTRIRSNIIGLNVIRALRDINARIQTHQLRLATGRRINYAADDPAGLSLATKLSSRSRILGQVFSNIGDARNLLSTAESGLETINELLIEIQTNIEQSASDTLGSNERQAITQTLIQLRDEIDATVSEVTHNGTKLLGSTTTFKFQTGETSQTTYTTAAYGVSDLGLTNLAALTTNDVVDSNNYQQYLDEVTAALSTVSSGLGTTGALTNRLEIKESLISIQQANVDASLSRIMDADLALEQLALTRNQVLQQSALATLVQANLNQESILRLFA